MRFLIPIFFILISLTNAQNVSYISSEMIREKFPKVKKAEEIIQSKVDEWIIELDNYQEKIDNVELDIEKNKLILTEQELEDRIVKLSFIKVEKAAYAASCFESGGEYDKLVKAVWVPIEKKIFDGTNEILGNQKAL